MAPGLRFQVVWSDDDVLLVRVIGSNGDFSGQIDAYVAHGGLADAAKTIAGFPKDPTDAREVVLGRFGSEWAGGAARLQFSCVDPAGHCAVAVVLESDGGRSAAGYGAEMARFHIRFAPAALDGLVAQLPLLESHGNGAVAALDATHDA